MSILLCRSYGTQKGWSTYFYKHIVPTLQLTEESDNSESIVHNRTPEVGTVRKDKFQQYHL